MPDPYCRKNEDGVFEGDLTPEQIDRKFYAALAFIKRTHPFEPELYRVEGDRTFPVQLNQIRPWR